MVGGHVAGVGRVIGRVITGNSSVSGVGQRGNTIALLFIANLGDRVASVTDALGSSSSWAFGSGDGIIAECANAVNTEVSCALGSSGCCGASRCDTELGRAFALLDGGAVCTAGSALVCVTGTGGDACGHLSGAANGADGTSSSAGASVCC